MGGMFFEDSQDLGFFFQESAVAQRNDPPDCRVIMEGFNDLGIGEKDRDVRCGYGEGFLVVRRGNFGNSRTKTILANPINRLAADAKKRLWF